LYHIWSLFFWLLFILFLNFGWLRILLRDFSKSGFYKVTQSHDSILEFWRLAWCDFNFFFTLPPSLLFWSFNIILLGLHLREFLLFSFYGVVQILYHASRESIELTQVDLILFNFFLKKFLVSSLIILFF